MEPFLLLLESKTWYALAAYAVITALLNLLIARRSQIDTWAESHPRIAAVLKLLRSLGVDPWMLIQSLSLFFRGKLPESAKTNPTAKSPASRSQHPPAAGGLAVLLIVVALSGAQSCRPSTGVDWPAVVSCAPAPADLVDRVAEVLLSDGAGSLSDRAVVALEALAREHAPAAVACAVAELVDQWTGQARSVDNAPGRRAAVRGAEFLKRIETQTYTAPE